MSTPTPTAPTTAELAARARALVPLLQEHAAAVDETGRIDPSVIAAIREAGLLRLTTPKRYGGYEIGFRDLIEIGSILAEGCGSTGWVTGYANTAKWTVGLCNAQLQDDVFADPDVIISGSSKPSFDVETVEGGYIISGTWPSLSGVPHSGWVGVFFGLTGEPGQPPRILEARIPTNEVTISHTWNVIGMRGTGSESVTADRVFVPEHRTIDASTFRSNDFHNYPTPYDEPLYRSAVHPVLSVVIGITPLGLAQAALDLVVENAKTRPLGGTTYDPQSESVSVQNEIAEAAALVDSARLHLYRAGADIDDWAARGEVMPPEIRARVRADTGFAVTAACAAIDRLLTAVGSGAFSTSNPLQRLWRDANVAARHGAANWMLNRELYGKVLLGVDASFNRLTV
ncbi:MAG: acyl-CoA dehydrogenase family protein [Microbacterium sp.]|uniref:acyl-CoA dehydrogenase family protein n=1 Tax=Microbacterium sp. TaxID=51671 RepID=UPI0039E24BB1